MASDEGYKARRKIGSWKSRDFAGDGGFASPLAIGNLDIEPRNQNQDSRKHNSRA